MNKLRSRHRHPRPDDLRARPNSQETLRDQCPDQGHRRANQDPSGLQYWEIKVGTGPVAQSGQSVKVHYTGWLTSGKKFDSSVDAGRPFDFTLGAGRGHQGMGRGRRRHEGWRANGNCGFRRTWLWTARLSARDPARLDPDLRRRAAGSEVGAGNAHVGTAALGRPAELARQGSNTCMPPDTQKPAV